MFESLSQRLSATVNRLRGRGRLTEENIRESMREVRIALLEADVALPVVQALIERVKVRAVGQEVLKSLSPGQALVKVVSDELTALMGTANAELNLAQQPPAVVLMAGLQGAGKTTTVAKLARFLTERKKKKVMVVSCDVYRPAAIEQLRTLAEQVGVKFFPSEAGQNPVRYREERDCRRPSRSGRRAAGRYRRPPARGRGDDGGDQGVARRDHPDRNPVRGRLHDRPGRGQYRQGLCRGVAADRRVLTKTDGDARGGAALSVRYVTGSPIKFLGAGEKTDALEPFHPDRVAQRILGMGDVLSLVEEVERKVDQEKAQKLAEKVIKGKRFDLNDMRDQLEQMSNMGGLAGLMDKLPGVSGLPDSVKSKVNDGEIKRMIAIIGSMTKKERRHPDLLNGSRRARVARGSGTQPADVNRLLKQYMQMEKMMSKLSKGGTKGLLRQMQGAMKGMGGMGGGFPPMR